MELRPLGFDSFGVKEEFAVDPETGKCYVKRTFAPETWDILRQNQALQNAGWDGYSGDKDKAFKHVASIPLQIVELWTEMFGVNPVEPGNEALLTRLLNDPEWAWVRTSRGRVKIREA